MPLLVVVNTYSLAYAELGAVPLPRRMGVALVVSGFAIFCLIINCKEEEKEEDKLRCSFKPFSEKLVHIKSAHRQVEMGAHSHPYT